MKIYKVEAFPDATFSTDARAQQELTDRTQRRDRWATWLFLVLLAIFLASVIVGFLGFLKITVIGIALMGALVVFGAVILLWLPSLNCPACDKKMRRDWKIIRGGRSGEFLVCTSCKIALYTHRTLR